VEWCLNFPDTIPAVVCSAQQQSQIEKVKAAAVALPILLAGQPALALVSPLTLQQQHLLRVGVWLPLCFGGNRIASGPVCVGPRTGESPRSIAKRGTTSRWFLALVSFLTPAAAWTHFGLAFGHHFGLAIGGDHIASGPVGVGPCTGDSSFHSNARNYSLLVPCTGQSSHSPAAAGIIYLGLAFGYHFGLAVWKGCVPLVIQWV